MAAPTSTPPLESPAGPVSQDSVPLGVAETTDVPQVSERAVSRGVLLAYALPRAGIGLVGVVVSTYFVKFATDVLLIAPALVAAVHAASRIWDGVTDPLVGYASDRTQSRWGRRRPWMFMSALALPPAVLLLWSPPTEFLGLGLVFWVAVGYLLYESAQTCCLVPHEALGVELSYDYHERTRLFAWQHVGLISGTLGGLAILSALTEAAEPRDTARTFALVGGGFLAATILCALPKLPERLENQGRGSARVLRAFADVFRNPHGRRLLYVYGVDRLGGACVLALVPFIAQYVLGDAGLFISLLLAYLAPQVFLTPVWLWLAGRMQKKRLWLISMWVTVAGFLVQFTFSESTPLALVLGTTFVLGIAAAIGAVCALAVKADVIDYDEYTTGERKEGSYIAVWNLVQKFGSFLPPFATLSLMELFGYVPNEAQNDATKLVMRSFYGLVPAVCFLIGIGIFRGFGFNRDELLWVRTQIDARRNRSS